VLRLQPEGLELRRGKPEVLQPIVRSCAARFCDQ